MCTGVKVGTGLDLVRFLAGPYFREFCNLTEDDSRRMGDLFHHALEYLRETKGWEG